MEKSSRIFESRVFSQYVHDVNPSKWESLLQDFIVEKTEEKNANEKSRMAFDRLMGMDVMGSLKKLGVKND